MPAEIPEGIETMIMGIVDQLSFDVEIFKTNIDKAVSTMVTNGMTDDNIRTVMRKDMLEGGRIFGQLRNDIKASVVVGINQSAKLGQYKNYDMDKMLFTWVTVGGHKVCPDCDARSDQTKTWAEWEAEGIPGSGWSVCKGYCYCVLDPTGKVSKRVNMQPPKGG